MSADEIGGAMVQQMQAVVNKAGDVFVDRLASEAVEGKIGIGPLGEREKRVVEKLFSEVSRDYIIAELAAVFSFVAYTALHEDRMLTQITPSFLDQCEEPGKGASERIAAKIGALPELARNALSSGRVGNATAASLLQDIVRTPPPGPLRSSFDAVVLSFLGE
ncbi:MAG: hypothetical protein FJZ95_08940 [Chloroflexi bacterium]|nr:hypothetical protein [Chloroflexota bacterium]